MAEMTEDELKRLFQREIDSARTNDDADLAETRAKALEYFEGKMDDLKAEEGRSSIVSKDVSDTVGWMLPGIMRVFTSSENMVLAAPVGVDDDEWAKQATIGLNHRFWKDNDGYRTLRDSIWDALVLKNAIIKVYYDDTPQYEVTFHSGLTDMALAQLIEDEDVDVLQHSETTELVWEPTGAPGQAVEAPVRLHEVKIKRLRSKGRIVIECIPPEDYLQDADAVFTKDARFRAHRARKTRSDLIEMGFDPKVVAGLAVAVETDREKNAREEREPADGVADKSMEEVELFECYLRTDQDGDGIAETIRGYYAGAELLDWEVWEDEGPFFDIPCDPIPHRWDGKSIADDTMDIQKNKTALMRQLMDNVYASNNPQRFVTGTIVNPEQLFSPTFGSAIFGETGATVQNITVPFVAGQALQALAYQDEVAQRRTGVSRQSMALDAEALQNQTATADQNNRDASYSQVELVARDMAMLGWTPVFRTLLKLEIKHQDTPRTIRLGKKSVRIDPKSWNADMDITVDVGLGTGSRERDMVMLQGVLGNQMGLIDRFSNSGFPEKALEMVPMVLNTLTKLTESAGIRNASSYFPTVTEDEMTAARERIAQMQNAPDPKEEQAKAKAEADHQYRMAQLSAQTQAEEAAARRTHERQLADIRATVEIKRYQTDQEIALKERLLVTELTLKRASGVAAPTASDGAVDLGGNPG